MDAVTDESRIIARLDAIREVLDAKGLRLGPPLTLDALTQIERNLEVPLPTEYRLFLNRVGHAGAGPHQGLFSLEKQDEEDLTDVKQLRKPFRWTVAFNPYDWDNPCGQEGIWCEEVDPDDAEEYRPQIILDIPGALYICNYGCAIRLFLIVKGECLGEVWRDAQAGGIGVLPERGNDGRHPSFLGWYEQWPLRNF